MMIEMHGGAINYNLQKGSKEISDPDFAEDVEKIYAVAINHWEYWNPFSDLLEKLFSPAPRELAVCKEMPNVQRGINKSGMKLNSVKTFNEIIGDLQKAGMINGVSRSKYLYEFSYKSEAVKKCLWDGGAILELHTYIKEKSGSDDCRVGVHLDWDGEIRWPFETDVMNEIDVLSIRGNIPTFISCKSGRLSQMQTLRALYELHTVADHFGGK